MITSKAALGRVEPGTKVRITNFLYPHLNSLRVIEKVQTKAWATRVLDPTPDQAARGLDRKEIWLSLDSSAVCKFDDLGFVIQYKEDNTPLCRVDWV